MQGLEPSVFRFLDLPAETRRNIYTVHSAGSQIRIKDSFGHSNPEANGQVFGHQCDHYWEFLSDVTCSTVS
jgi:hypothetical protein